VDTKQPTELILSPEDACILSVEFWRLSKLAQQEQLKEHAVKIGYSAGRLRQLLDHLDIEVTDFCGQPYDPGLPAEVISIVLDDTIANGLQIVAETVVPTVIWSKQIIEAGQIIVAQSAA
jgi:hypothetical protein